MPTNILSFAWLLQLRRQNHAAMTTMLLLFAVFLLGGCASTINGPVGSTVDYSTPAVSAPSPGKQKTAATADLKTAPSATAMAPIPVTLDLTVAPDDLWHRIRNGFGMPDLHNPLVADRQSWYLNRPDMLRRIFERGRRYLYHIVDELEKRGMPTELAFLPMVESAFNPQALSSARAMGIWQFIPSTGKNFKLDQNWWVDERRDIIASTDAALDYLQAIYEMHGDWHLALASYNWGEYAVARAIAKNVAKGLPTDYSSLTMPGETRYYVPKLQALKNIIAHPELFGFHPAPIPNRPYFETVMKADRMDVAVAARLAEISIEEFISLNPAYHRPVMKSDQAGPLVLPADKVGTYLANLERYEAQDIPLSNWQTYQMKRGDTLAKVAARYSIGTSQLEQINGITRRVKVGPGFNLLVPRPGSQASTELMARALPKEPPLKTIPLAKPRDKNAKVTRSAKTGKTAPTAQKAKPSGKTVTKTTPSGKRAKPAAKSADKSGAAGKKTANAVRKG